MGSKERSAKAQRGHGAQINPGVLQISYPAGIQPIQMLTDIRKMVTSESV